VGALNARQQRFVLEYLLDLNATRAAIRAGYSKKTARQQGQRLLTNVDIQHAISEAIEERAERTRVEADRVVLELARLGLYDPCDIAEWGPDGIRLKASGDISEDAARAVAHIRVAFTRYGRAVTLRFADRLKALEMLGKHLGLFSERVEVSGQAREPVRFIEVNGAKREDADAD
jgi:phage terminase small subunit